MEPRSDKALNESLLVVLEDLDARLDEALRQTFPASDPIAVSAEKSAPALIPS